MLYNITEAARSVISLIKEFSSIDGAFVIRGDGVVESAGSLIQATDNDHSLPSGLGRSMLIDIVPPTTYSWPSGAKNSFTSLRISACAARSWRCGRVRS